MLHATQNYDETRMLQYPGEVPVLQNSVRTEHDTKTTSPFTVQFLRERGIKGQILSAAIGAVIRLQPGGDIQVGRPYISPFLTAAVLDNYT
jgi:hypothetical protein